MGGTQLKTIVYVDDEADIREIVQMSLDMDEGITAHACESGEEALALMEEVKPDLVLLDVMMTGMDGPATLRRMREKPALADVPVIFMTAKAMPAEVAALRAMGALGVIDKPFDPMNLGKKMFALWRKTPPPKVRADSSALQVRMGRLGTDFIHRTLHDVARLRTLLDGADSTDPGKLKQVERLAHSIRGTGAALGFTTIADCAADIERVAALPAREGTTVDPQIATQLLALTSRLGGFVDKLAGGLGAK
jgi:two-component system OmpR family response regulator